MQDQPREPLPKSFRPAWIFIGWMVLVVIVTGIVAALINWTVQ